MPCRRARLSGHSLPQRGTNSKAIPPPSRRKGLQRHPQVYTGPDPDPRRLPLEIRNGTHEEESRR
jgi:hypothetical protein